MGMQEVLLFVVLSGVFVWTFYKLYKMHGRMEYKDDKSS